MADLVQEYFVNPIRFPSQYAPYNVVNTLVYAAIALAAIYLLYRIMKRAGIKIDEAFFNAVLPFVVFGSALRVFEDAHLLPREVTVFGQTFFPFVTPGIYVVTFLVLALALLASFVLDRRNVCGATQKIGAAAALAVLLSLLVLVPPNNFVLGIAMVVLAGMSLKAFEWVNAKRKVTNSFIEKAAFFSQALDGAASFIGIQFAGYSEQHVVGGFIISSFTPLAFFLVKIAFVYVVLEVLRREYAERRNEEERTYILLLITIFGLAPGIRDLLRIASGV